MKEILCDSYEQLGRKAADLIGKQIEQKADSVLGFATGSTPISTYQALIADNQAGKLDFSRVRSVNLDEYCQLDRNHSQSYYTFMHQQLFSHINIKKENAHLPDPYAKDPAVAYDALIESLGGIDLQILGIGLNGHIGFNEPSETIFVGTHIVDLTPSTREANARFFASMDEVPTQAITMGLGSIMRARKILLLASGENKREIVDRALHGPVTPLCPASFLQLHPDVTVLRSF